MLLLQRLFWYPLIEDPSEPGHRSSRRTCTRAGFITLALCLVFLWFAQKFFSRLENKFPERLEPMTISIEVENVSKQFTLQYHRTLKQMAVATAKRCRCRRRSSRSTMCPSPSSRVSRSG